MAGPICFASGTASVRSPCCVRVRRTATVAAVTDARLLSVQSEDFLAAVTGSEHGHALVEEITAAHEARDRSLRVRP